MAVSPKVPEHDEQLQRVQDACAACGLTFAIRERYSPSVTAVTIQLPSQRTPAIYGVVTAFGLSINLQDMTRITGPEKNKLKDVFTYLTRV